MNVNDLSTQDLITLIQLIAPLQTLIDELEKNLHLEMVSNTGQLAARNYAGIHDAIKPILKDDYLASLVLDDSAVTDHEIVTQLLLVGKQLLRYLQTITGVGHMGQHHVEIQTAPYIIVNAQNSGEQTKQDVFDMIRRFAPTTEDARDD